MLCRRSDSSACLDLLRWQWRNPPAHQPPPHLLLLPQHQLQKWRRFRRSLRGLNCHRRRSLRPWQVLHRIAETTPWSGLQHRRRPCISQRRNISVRASTVLMFARSRRLPPVTTFQRYRVRQLLEKGQVMPGLFWFRTSCGRQRRWQNEHRMPRRCQGRL